MMPTTYAIETDQLTKRFREHTAVDTVSLEVQRGSVFGFLGPNGAGKTTTIAMLLGLVKPTSGRAILLGHDVQRDPVAALRAVGAMIEAPAFYSYLGGRDNLRVLARIDGVPDHQVDTVLATVELTDRARNRVGTYSQGMKQRLAIAAALLKNPQLIILDEPTNGLDPAGQVEIRSLIHTLAAQGHTIFLSSHMLHEVERLCQQVAILKQGRVLAQGPVDDLLQRGQGVYVRVMGDPTSAQALLQAVPWITAVRREHDALLIDAPGDRVPEINAILAGQGVPVAEIRADTTSLEQFFLEVTNTQP